jgi:hypothetical protein
MSGGSTAEALATHATVAVELRPRSVKTANRDLATA